MQLQLHLAAPAEVANLPLGTPLQRTSRRVLHVGPGRSHRPFFLPLFTNVVEEVFSEDRLQDLVVLGDRNVTPNSLPASHQ